MPSQPQKAFSSETGETDCTAEEMRALDQRFLELYGRIKRLAARIRWNGTNPTLNPTALAHEAYIKLREDSTDFAAKSYEQVIAIFAKAMHQILIDAARRKSAQKRIAGGLPQASDLPVEDALTIANALDGLEREYPVQARIAQCRFLLGMTVEETSAALAIPKRTVERQWQEAKEWLGGKIDPARS